MIPLEKLRSLKRAYVHANCPDGVASALILRDALPYLDVRFVKYGTAEHREIEPLPNTIFCDFSPWLPKLEPEPEPEYRSLLIDSWVQKEVIVLDHHSKDIVEPYPFGVFGENDKLECGAMLAYREVWQPVRERDSRRVRVFAERAAIRDTWQTKHPDWEAANTQASELMFWKFDQLSLSMGTEQLVVTSIPLGARLFERQIELAESCIKEAFSFTSEQGTRVLMFQGVSATSDAAELLEARSAIDFLEVLPPNPDLVVGFHYRMDGGKLQLQFSTRSHTGFDCQALAQAHGGNGHKAAAGFTISVLEGNLGKGMNPYAVFQMLLKDYEAKL